MERNPSLPSLFSLFFFLLFFPHFLFFSHFLSVIDTQKGFTSTPPEPVNERKSYFCTMLDLWGFLLLLLALSSEITKSAVDFQR